MSDIPIRQLSDLPGDSHFKIKNLNTLLSGKELSEPLHRHSFYYLLILEEGHGIHSIDFAEYEVKAGTVFLLKPGQVHSLHINQPAHGYILQFGKELLSTTQNSHLRSLAQNSPIQLSKESLQKVILITKSIENEYLEQKQHLEEAIGSWINLLFIELNRQQKKAALSTDQTHAQEKLETFTELLETHIQTCKQVSEYADNLHLSTYQLNAITKKLLGKTASEIINEQIILEAKRHLLTTNNQVNEIAYHLGYNDPSYFIRFFKKHMDLSPEAFRKKYK